MACVDPTTMLGLNVSGSWAPAKAGYAVHQARKGPPQRSDRGQVGMVDLRLPKS